MIKIENKQVFSTNDKMVHRLGTESYFIRGTVLTDDTVEMFEEVDVVPAYTKAQYDAKVAELVRSRYSASEEFALQRKAINAAIMPATLTADVAERVMDEYAAYNVYVEQCKEEAKATELYNE